MAASSEEESSDSPPEEEDEKEQPEEEEPEEKPRRQRTYVYGRPPSWLTPELKLIVVLIVVGILCCLTCPTILRGDQVEPEPDCDRSVLEKGGKATMAAYEYRVEHKPAGGRMGQINDRLDSLAEQGWEPILMSGSDDLNILLRRPKPQPDQPAEQVAAAAIAES